jgi:hypothetical protein
VPSAGPRTKPKALNIALPFARGTFTVIYDAEDRPEPDQLRRALQAFRAGDDDLACVQARLCIDNTADSLLTRLYTAEYAGQFDVFLPGLSDISLPRLARAVSPRTAVDFMGADIDAGALAVAVAGGLARSLPARGGALCLGEDRAWPGEKLATCRQHDPGARGTRALSQQPERNRQAANTLSRRYKYRRRSAAAASGRRLNNLEMTTALP